MLVSGGSTSYLARLIWLADALKDLFPRGLPSELIGLSPFKFGDDTICWFILSFYANALVFATPCRGEETALAPASTIGCAVLRLARNVEFCEFEAASLRCMFAPERSLYARLLAAVFLEERSLCWMFCGLLPARWPLEEEFWACSRVRQVNESMFGSVGWSRLTLGLE